jgi:enoyl-CoA hydratase
MSDKIISRAEDGIGHIVFNNPEKRNAVSLDMWEEVGRILDEFAADESLRVLVLSGAGGKAFVSGADISKFESERGTAEASARYNAISSESHKKLVSFPKPTIAKIQGSCVGGGVGLAVCCDLRICGQSSRFSVPAAKLGVGYGLDSLSRLIHLIGPSFAKEVFFTARLFSAAEAYEMGLVNRVVPDEEVEAYAADYARTIAENAPLTVNSVKAIIGEALKDPEDRDLARCKELVDACFASQDYIEGRRAFMEKRKPRFIGA